MNVYFCKYHLYAFMGQFHFVSSFRVFKYCAFSFSENNYWVYKCVSFGLLSFVHW